jgi:hypothetical protein
MPTEMSTVLEKVSVKTSKETPFRTIKTINNFEEIVKSQNQLDQLRSKKTVT